MPPGLECYKSVEQSSNDCLLPCKGVYADVQRRKDVGNIKDMEMVKSFSKYYKDYKSGLINGTTGKSSIS